MDMRQQRGLEMAAKFKILKKDDGTWSVPSQTGKGRRYSIEMGTVPRCTCAYQETHGVSKCKHIFAVEYFLQRELNDDGSETVTETVTLTQRISRKTYPQNWPAYNAAQTTEKAEFQRLLYALCSGIDEPQQTKGRPRIPLTDAVFSIAFKVFSTMSGRRFISDLTDAKEKGYIQKVPHFNSIFNYLDMPELTSILMDLIEQSSLPLAAVETAFAVDSTGFGSSRFTTWYATKYGDVLDQRDWVKAHVCCGVQTNIVTAVRVTDRNANDAPFLPELVQTTAKSFQLEEVSADKGYSSRTNTDVIGALGAVPYLAYRRNSKADRPSKRGKLDTLWTRMYHLYSFNQDEFLAHYHKRSNVETTFMSIKAKFGDAVRSRTFVAQRNEVLCKVLCHNICCVIGSMHELGIDPGFGRAA
jgi:transposase